MITDSISDYIELGWKRKAIMACVLLAEEQNLISSEETKILWEHIEKHITKDKF